MNFPILIYPFLYCLILHSAIPHSHLHSSHLWFCTLHSAIYISALYCFSLYSSHLHLCHLQFCTSQSYWSAWLIHQLIKTARICQSLWIRSHSTVGYYLTIILVRLPKERIHHFCVGSEIRSPSFMVPLTGIGLNFTMIKLIRELD